MKKFIFSAAILGLVAPIALATTSASADTLDPLLNQSTNANVSFTGVAKLPGHPVIPTNPSDSTNPNDDNQTNNTNTTDPTKGGLILQSAPTFNFTKVDLSTFSSDSGIPVDAKSIGKNPYYVQIGDNRSTGASGWSLTADLGSFTNNVTSNKQLPNGTTLNLSSTKVFNSSTGATAVNKGYVADNIVMSQGSTGTGNRIATANSGSGYGVTSINWDTSNVTLNLPANTTSIVNSGESYTAPITWTLGSTAES